MDPLHVRAVWEYARATAANGMDPIPFSPGTLGAMVAVVAAFRISPDYMLLLIVVGLALAGVTLDLVVGMTIALRDGTFCRDRLYGGLAGKLLRLLLIVAGLVLDLTIVAGLGMLYRITDVPALLEWKTLWGTYLLLMSGSAIWLTLAEAASVYEKIGKDQGTGLIFPGVHRALRWFRRLLVRGIPDDQDGGE